MIRVIRFSLSVQTLNVLHGNQKISSHSKTCSGQVNEPEINILSHPQNVVMNFCLLASACECLELLVNVGLVG